LIAVYQPHEPAWQELTDYMDGLLRWERIDVRLLFGNLLASTLAVAAMPMLYGMRRVAIRRHHGPQLRDLREFANADPETLIAELRADAEGLDEEAQSYEPDDASLVPEQPAWFHILGVLPSAGAEEIKLAYKALVKQNHPDRVHGLSPQLRAFAEQETRKLNAAYEEAIASLRWGGRGAGSVRRSESVQD
jgi:hypothetical protein